MATNESINQLGIPVIGFEVNNTTPHQMRAVVNPSQNVRVPVDKTLTVDDMAADAKVTGDAIRGLIQDVSDLDAKTGADIPLTGETGSPTISDAYDYMVDELAALAGLLYPVGSIYQTTESEMPAYIAAVGTI